MHRVLPGSGQGVEAHGVEEEKGQQRLLSSGRSSRGGRSVVHLVPTTSRSTLPPRPPGVLDTMASAVRPVSMLIRLDLPTLDRPMTAGGKANSTSQDCSGVQLSSEPHWTAR